MPVLPQYDSHRVPSAALAPLIQAWLDDHAKQHPDDSCWDRHEQIKTGPQDSFAALLAERGSTTKETWLRQLRLILSDSTVTVGFVRADEIVCHGLGNPSLWHTALAEWYWPFGSKSSRAEQMRLAA